MEVRSALNGVTPSAEWFLGDPGICIAVLDGPVDLSHTCFTGANLRKLATLVREPAGPGPMSLHGTHVASLLFGQPGSPVVGIAPRCRGLILPVFPDGQEGRVSQLDLARAIERAVQEGAQVINVSGGERTPDGQADPMLERALRLCDDNGVLVVAAVGNDGCECLQVPAAVPSVLAVGAADAGGRPLPMNNWSDAYSMTGVLAPGQDIEGAAPGGGRRALTGSSFATPVVSGIAALLLSEQVREGYEVAPRAVGRAIVEAASPGASEDGRHLAGNLNVARAYELITRAGKKVMTSSDVATIPSQPEQPGARPAESIPLASPETGVTAAGEPAQLGTCHCESSGAEAVDTDGVQVAAASAAADAPPQEPPPMRAAAPVVASGAQASGVRPSSDCGCGGADVPRPLIYAIGTIGFDFRTEARRDSFRQQMDRVQVRRPEEPEVFTTAPANPYDPTQLSAYLARNPWASDKLTWTLNLEQTPIYALEAETSVGMTWGEPFIDPSADPRWDPAKAKQAELAQRLTEFSSFPPVSMVYKTFRDAIVGQAQLADAPGFISRVSIPGLLTNRTTRLFSGQVVPVVEVKSRGIHTWNEAELVKAAMGEVKSDANQRGAAAAIDDTVLQQNIRAFLDKIYYQFRNLGQSSADRALNYAATNAFMVTNELRQGLLSGKYVPGPDEGLYTLDTISVSKSPYCRFDSECEDVLVTFFDPENERRAKVSYLFTIDVSDEYPVSLAPAHRFLGGV